MRTHGLFGPLSQNTKTEWLIQQKLISHSTGVWKSMIKVEADMVSGEALFLAYK